MLGRAPQDDQWHLAVERVRLDVHRRRSPDRRRRGTPPLRWAAGWRPVPPGRRGRPSAARSCGRCRLGWRLATRRRPAVTRHTPCDACCRTQLLMTTASGRSSHGMSAGIVPPAVLLGDVDAIGPNQVVDVEFAVRITLRLGAPSSTSSLRMRFSPFRSSLERRLLGHRLARPLGLCQPAGELRDALVAASNRRQTRERRSQESTGHTFRLSGQATSLGSWSPPDGVLTCSSGGTFAPEPRRSYGDGPACTVRYPSSTRGGVGFRPTAVNESQASFPWSVPVDHHHRDRRDHGHSAVGSGQRIPRDPHGHDGHLPRRRQDQGRHVRRG